MHPTISTPPIGSIAPGGVGCQRRKKCKSAQGQCWLLQRSWVCIRDCYHIVSHHTDKMLYEGTSQLKEHREHWQCCTAQLFTQSFEGGGFLNPQGLVILKTQSKRGFASSTRATTAGTAYAAGEACAMPCIRTRSVGGRAF